MANLGLGNMIELKRHLLSPDIVSQTKYDVRITDIGQGVAKLFDKFCNRKFERASGTTDIFHAERSVWILERYPVETITTVEERIDVATGWVSAGAVNSVLQNWDANSGLVQFPSVNGSHLSELRITYTGGYWFDTAETENTSQPAGSTLVPDDVKEAWYLQCKKVWENYDPLGKKIAQDVDEKTPILKLLPAVEEMLRGHVRMNIS